MGEKESIQIRDAILHNGLEIGGYLVIFLFGTIMTLGML